MAHARATNNAATLDIEWRDPSPFGDRGSLIWGGGDDALPAVQFGEPSDALPAVQLGEHGAGPGLAFQDFHFV